MNQHFDPAAIQPDAVLDAYGLLCPIPIIKTARMVKTLPPGSILEIIATDGGIVADLANWCKSHKHQYLGCRQEGRVYRAFMQVSGQIK
jgi:TusA-related sulfurtransferase